MKIRLIHKTVFLVTLTALVSSSLQATPFKEYRPTWKVGQKWAIEVRGKTQPKKLAVRNPPPFVAQWGTVTRGFVVEKIIDVEGDPCWCIRIDYIRNGKQYQHARTYYRAYYRVSDSSLKREERISLKTGEIEVYTNFSGGVSIIKNGMSSLPVEFPFFLADSEKHSPKPFKIWKDGTKHYKSYEAYQTAHIIEKNVRGEEKKVLSIYIKEKDEVKEQEGLAAVQLWEKGMPWWSEATETENGKFRCKARLISIDGKKLENPRPWNLGPANSQ